MIKVGASIKYNEDSEPIMTLDYKGGLVDSISTFHENGKLFEVYKSISGRAKFKEVYDREGNQILDDNGDGEVTHMDKVNNRQIKNEYENYQLLSSSFIDSNNRRLFLYTQDHLEYKFFEKFAMSADKIFDDFQLTQNDDKLNFGYLLLECIVNEKGKTESLSIKKPLNPGLDQQLIEKLSAYLINKKEFIAGEYQKNNVAQIVIFPLYLGYVDLDLFHNNHWTDGFKSGGYWLNHPYYMNAFPSLTY